MSVLIPLDRIVDDHRAWPRERLDEERVAGFVELLHDAGQEAFEPVTLVPDGERYQIGDGRHRIAATRLAGFESVPALLRSCQGKTPIDYAFEIGVEASAISAQPLTRREKELAVLRLLATGGRSEREIARLTGVSHPTVRRVRERGDAAAAQDRAAPSRPDATVDAIARRLVAGIARLWEARPLSDRFLGDRMGHRLADALDAQFGDEALPWAERLERWAGQAAADLGEDEG